MPLIKIKQRFLLKTMLWRKAIKSSSRIKLSFLSLYYLHILRLAAIHQLRQLDGRVYTGLDRQTSTPQPPTEVASVLKVLSLNLHRDSRRCSSCRRRSRSAAVRRPIPANRHVMISDPKCLETYKHTHTLCKHHTLTRNCTRLGVCYPLKHVIFNLFW